MPAFLQQVRSDLARLAPGLLVCSVIALAATFLSEHYGGPQLLYALLIGLSFHFLLKNPQVKPGVDFCGRTVLRIGVALLGARITLTQVVLFCSFSTIIGSMIATFFVVLKSGAVRLAGIE